MTSTIKPATDRRRHERFPLLFGLASGPVATLRSKGGAVFPVINWSYGGLQIAVVGNGDSEFAASGGKETGHPVITGILHLALASKLTQAVQFNVIATSANTISCAFVHDTPDALLFLRPWMECLRRGTAMTELAPDVIKPELASAGWQVWRGDGPLTLSIQAVKAAFLDWCLVFQVGEGYGEVGATGGKIFSRKSVDNDGRASSRMQASGANDPVLLNMAVMHCIGAGSAVPPALCIAIIDQLRKDPCLNPSF